MLPVVHSMTTQKQDAQLPGPGARDDLAPDHRKRKNSIYEKHKMDDTTREESLSRKRQFVRDAFALMGKYAPRRTTTHYAADIDRGGGVDVKELSSIVKLIGEHQTQSSAAEHWRRNVHDSD